MEALSRLLYKTTGIVPKDSNVNVKPLPKLNKAFQTCPVEDSDDEEPINVRDCQRELDEFELRLNKTNSRSEFERWSPELDAIIALPKSQQTLLGVYGRLRTLHLIELKITSIDSFFPIYLQQLDVLDLSGNQLSRLQHLPPKISQLDAYNNRIDVIDQPALPESLIHLGLGCNTIATFPQCPLPALMSLDLSFNNLTSLVQVAAALPSVRSLRHLFLQGNPMTLCVSYRQVILSVAPELEILDEIPVAATEIQPLKIKPWDAILLSVTTKPPVEMSYQIGRLETYSNIREPIVHELKPSVALRDAILLEKFEIELCNFKTQVTLSEFLTPNSTQAITIPVENDDIEIEIQLNQIYSSSNVSDV